MSNPRFPVTGPAEHQTKPERHVVQQGCACDNSLLNVLPMVNSSPEAITTGAPPALGIAVHRVHVARKR